MLQAAAYNASEKSAEAILCLSIRLRGLSFFWSSKLNSTVSNQYCIRVKVYTPLKSCFFSDCCSCWTLLLNNEDGRFMNLLLNLCSILLTVAVDAFHRRHVVGTNSLRRGSMSNRRNDSFRFLSPNELPENESLKAKKSSKRLILIRHGQTYMNELIGGRGITFGEPNFTDVFQDPEDKEKYHDSPLSDVGIQQARVLNSKIGDLTRNDATALGALGLSEDNANFLDDLDLVVVSPLTRALQTLEISLYEHIVNRNDGCREVPILATAAAAERLYLVSDLGKPRSELRSNYPFVDFDTAFFLDCDERVCAGSSSKSTHTEEKQPDVWHFSPTEQIQNTYSEWRPHGQGQRYACLGEPTEYFDRRMSNFYYWLESREEECIAIVCHAGVIDWLTSGEQFKNCELRVQTFNSLRPRALQNRETSSD